MSRFFLFIFIILLSYSNHSLAADNKYLIENIEAKAYSTISPSDARNTAIIDVQREAFAVLLTRLDLDPNIIKDITNEEIVDMVRSQQIENEKIAGNNYSANFNIMFAKDFVDHILVSRKIIKSKSVQIHHLIIPAKTSIDGRILVWEQENDWRYSIKKAIEDKLGTEDPKFLIPEADIENIAILSQENIAITNYKNIEHILKKYNANSAYIALFNYQEIANKVNIDILKIHKFGKNKIRLSFVNSDNLEYNALSSKIADKTIDYLMSEPVEKNVESEEELTKIYIPINSLKDWIAMKRTIESSDFIDSFALESVSRDHAIILVKYNQPKENLIDSFKKIGFNLAKRNNETFILINN